MRIRTVAVLVVFVLLLAGVTAWALMPRAGGPARGAAFDAALATLNPDSLRAIEITQPTGKSIRIELDQRTRQWLTRVTPAAAWPVVSSRPRALAGLLADVAKAPREKSSEPVGTRTVTVTHDSNGTPTTHTIRVDATALAGRTRVYTMDATGQWWSTAADAQFASLFTPESLNAWADTHALVDLGQMASRVRLECADGRIELIRQGTRWSITEPKLGLADPQAVTALLQQLAEFTRTHPASPSTAPNGEASRSVFFASVECELADSAGSRILAQTIRVRSDAISPDAVEAEASAFAETRPGETAMVWGPAIARLDRAKFDAFSADPAVYVARIASQVSRADIAIIRVTRELAALDAATVLTPLTAAAAPSTRALTISTNGAAWRITPPTSTGPTEPASRGEPATPEQEKWIAQLRDLLTSTRAESVSMKPNKDLRGDLVLTLASPSGAPLDVVAIATTREHGAPRVVIRRAGVYLTYNAPEGAALVEWLERQLPPEG